MQKAKEWWRTHARIQQGWQPASVAPHMLNYIGEHPLLHGGTGSCPQWFYSCASAQSKASKTSMQYWKQVTALEKRFHALAEFRAISPQIPVSRQGLPELLLAARALMLRSSSCRARRLCSTKPTRHQASRHSASPVALSCSPPGPQPCLARKR